jgi:hypothetical protein
LDDIRRQWMRIDAQAHSPYWAVYVIKLGRISGRVI